MMSYFVPLILASSLLRMTFRMSLKTYDFKGVSEGDFEEAFKGDFEVIFFREPKCIGGNPWP